MNLKELIRSAILEDLPQGDLTTDLLGCNPKPGTAKLLAKEDLTLSGASLFEEVILHLEPNAEFRWYFTDGDQVLKNQIVCSVQGDLISLLKAERTALNFVMHLSGIASLTSRFCERIKHTRTRILDTRKTTPGYRELEKKAVIHGGGLNHRMNLSSAILIKDNHIKVVGGVSEAILRIRKRSPLPIEVEVRTMEELKEAVALKPHRILLDNMDTPSLAAAVQLIPADIETEASGNMNLDRVREVAETGVHFISVGALTHSAPSADLSLKFDWS